MNNLRILSESNYNLIDTAVRASIKNKLRAICEQNKQIVEMYYSRYRNGEFSEEEAKRRMEKILLRQVVGQTECIYLVNSQGVLTVHPELKGADLARYDFIQDQIRMKQGYLEYSWKNPSDKEERKKALYMIYFQPWDAIISASSYQDEFVDLIDPLDIKRNILSVSIGDSGYMYVMNSKGDLIIHPKLEGTNIYDSVDSRGDYFIRKIVETRNGTIVYPWQNPGESHPREKIVMYRYFEPLDWFLCCGVYVDELVKPIKTMEKQLVGISLAILAFAVVISLVYGKILLKPIQRLIFASERVLDGNFDIQIENVRHDEIGHLTAIFNDMVSKIKRGMADLQQTNRELENINVSLEQKVLERTKQLELLSIQDGLTGIANRRKMDEYLQHEWELAVRNKMPLSFILFDIDYFKRFNDTYGHPQGDECLKQVAAALTASLRRATDFAARYGGEEFVAILSNVDKGGAYITADRMRRNIENLS